MGGDSSQKHESQGAEATDTNAMYNQGGQYADMGGAWHCLLEGAETESDLLVLTESESEAGDPD